MTRINERYHAVVVKMKKGLFMWFGLCNCSNYGSR